MLTTAATSIRRLTGLVMKVADAPGSKAAIDGFMAAEKLGDAWSVLRAFDPIGRHEAVAEGVTSRIRVIGRDERSRVLATLSQPCRMRQGNVVLLDPRFDARLGSARLVQITYQAGHGLMGVFQPAPKQGGKPGEIMGQAFSPMDRAVRELGDLVELIIANDPSIAADPSPAFAGARHVGPQRRPGPAGVGSRRASRRGSRWRRRGLSPTVGGVGRTGRATHGRYMLNPADLDLDDDFAIDAPGSKPAALDGPAVAPAVPAALEPDSVAAQALYEVWSGERIVTIDSPPGAGKTRTIVIIAAHLGQRSPLKVVIGTPTRAQAFATAARLCEQMPAEKVVLAMNRVAQGDAPEGVTVAPSAAPEVGSVQVRTLASCQRKGSAPKCDVFIIDESYQATYALGIGRDQLRRPGAPGGRPRPDRPGRHRRHHGVGAAADRSAPSCPRGVRPHRQPGPHEPRCHLAAWPADRRGHRPAVPVRLPLGSPRPPHRRRPRIEPLIVPAADTPYDPVVLAQVAEQAAALSEATLVEGDQRTKLRPEDVAVVVSHNAQVSGVHGQLHAIGVEGVEVGTADRLQGGEWHAVVALDPFIGHEGLSPHTLSLGRACVMASRHATHLSWMHDGKWALAIAEADMPERLASSPSRSVSGSAHQPRPTAAPVAAPAAGTGKRVWIIEADDTHTPGELINAASVWPGVCRVQRDGDDTSVLWERRNVIDHATGERLR